MKRCLIVGAGGAGVEILSWALQMNQPDWKIDGFLDANPGALDGRNVPYRIFGDPATWKPSEDEVFISGIGTSEARLRTCHGLLSRGGQFVRVIHPSVITGLNADIGTGCVLSPNVVVSANAIIEAFVHINIAASIGHDSHTGEGATISSHCDLMAGVSIGRGAFLGSHACILPNKKVGEFAVVGAGSAVIRNVPARTTVMGVPAQIVSKPKDQAAGS